MVLRYCLPMMTGITFHHLQVTDEALHTLKVHESGILVATGCEGGNVALMELTEGLASSNRNDKTAVTAMFERETRREKILEVTSLYWHCRSYSTGG